MSNIIKTTQHLTAEVFFYALKAMPKQEQSALLWLIAKDKRLRQDLLDISLSVERLEEPARPLKAVLQEVKARSKRA